MERDAVIALLGQTSVFDGLVQAALERLADHVRLVELAAADWLFQEGDRGDACYVVAEGVVRLVAGHGSPEETNLALLGPGGFFGELSLLEPDGRRSAGALALAPSLLLAVPAAAFDELLRHHPAVALNVLRRVAANQRQSDARAIRDLRQKNNELTAAYDALHAAQAEALRRARVAREIELARDLQHSLLPRDLPRHSLVRCSAASFPAFEMSGDFYDVQLVDDTLMLVMADVCDKGAQAALLMAFAKGLLQAAQTGHTSPLGVARRTNSLLCATGVAGAVVTLVYATLNLANGQLRYARAGHEWPLHYRAADASVIALEAAGMPLGIDADALLDEGQVVLARGDALLLYTDGLTEARGSRGAEYGRDRLVAAVQAYGHLDAAALADALLHDVRAWQGDAPPSDDVTLLVVQLR